MFFLEWMLFDIFCAQGLHMCFLFGLPFGLNTVLGRFLVNVRLHS